MTIDSTDNNEGNSFEYRLKEVSDEEIVSILRYRDHYQPQAVKAAVREALKRGIIKSLDDLENDEFKSQPIPPKNLFPISSVETQNLSIFKSLCRICYIFGLILSIFAVFQIVDHHLTMGVIALTIGISLILVTFRLEKEKKLFLSQLLLVFNFPAIGYAIYRLSSVGNPSTMDIIAASVIILVLLYTTLYIYKLTIRFNRN
jgi:hypothetical protein